MQFLSRSVRRRLQHSHRHFRTLSELAPPIEHVRDRGLDHAVAREKHLIPLLNVKNLIKSEPSKSLPLSLISHQRDSLEIYSRPIDFIRKYPSVFEEFRPGGVGIYPHIKLTQQVLDLDSKEQLVYDSESYRQNVADRLLKLLMISRIHKIPLKVLDVITWDLGLPRNYLESIVPEFPDCFRVIGDKNLLSRSNSGPELELVCWSDELAVSFLEKNVKSGGVDLQKGMPIAFPLEFSKGFEGDKKLKKWYEDWQKLPYISPYENALHFATGSSESDKWVVGILHELLHLFISKKVKKESLLYLGEWLGIRSRIKKALLYHPGTFYQSSTLGTRTVVLREAYKRALLVQKNPLMDVRNQYIHLMNLEVKNHKATTVPGANGKKEDNSEGLETSNTGFDVEDDTDDMDDYNDESTYAQTSGQNKNLNLRAPSRIFGRGRSEKHSVKGNSVKGNSPIKHDSNSDEEDHEIVNKMHVHRYAATSDKEKILNSRRPPRISGGERSGKHHTKRNGLLKDSSRRVRRESYNLHESTQENLTSPIVKGKLLTERNSKVKDKY